MPSPFPGMDPFLEHPYFLPGLHGSLTYVLSRTLQHALPPPYYAVLNERLWVETSDRRIEPDVDVLASRPNESSPSRLSGAVLVAVQPVVIEVADDERRETYVDIMTRNELDERIVTTLEILSLTNKTPGEQGRQLYLRKQREVIDGHISLVEIDLLRGGMHSTAVSRRRLIKEAGPFDYHVCIARGSDSKNRYVYPFRMQDPLPIIEVPLLPDDAPVPLNLQAVFDESYDDGPFRRRVPYELHRVVPPLSAEQAAWAAERLKQD